VRHAKGLYYTINKRKGGDSQCGAQRFCNRCVCLTKYGFGVGGGWLWKLHVFAISVNTIMYCFYARLRPLALRFEA
jgi:hypothetical protein